VKHAKAVKLQQAPSDYLRTNFYVTTSGQFPHAVAAGRHPAGGRRSRDVCGGLPFELLEDGAAWLDGVGMDEGDRAKIGRKNAERLLKI
jgi:2,3-dihydroxybenzoate decarboxylase